MTTIAYKNGIIAYDSRFTCNDVIVDDNANKMIEADGRIFFMCGSVPDYVYLISSYLNDKLTKRVLEPVKALVLDSGKLYSAAVSPRDGFWKCEEPFGVPIAIGSGYQFALAFMDTGMTAEEAVHATCKRDIYTGGLIRTFKIDR